MPCFNSEAIFWSKKKIFREHELKFNQHNIRRLRDLEEEEE